MIRRIGAIVLAAPLAMGFPVLAATPAAAADMAVTAPRNGAVITSGSQVTARATIAWWGTNMQLEALTPGGGRDSISSGYGASTKVLSGTLSIRNNGRYTVRLRGGVTQKIYSSVTFTVRIPPARPSGVSASASGGKVTVRWNLGLEDDLSGYTISGSGVSGTSGGTGRFCTGTSCAATLNAKPGASTASISVRAQRPSGTGGSVMSGASVASARLGGGNSGGDGGGSTNPPGSTIPTNPPGTTPPGQTPITPFNNQSPLTLPSVQPPGSTPGFMYPTPQVAGESGPKAQNVAAANSLQWGKSIGIALVLLVVAAHLGTWTRRLRVAQAGVSDKGMAARMARAGAGRKRVSKQREQIARAEALAKKGAPVAAGMAAQKGAKDAKGGRFGKAAPAAPVAPGAKPDAAKPEAGKGGDTKVMVAAKPAAKRRPATLGKRQDGVNVRIAGKDGQPAKGRRAKGHRK